MIDAFSQGKVRDIYDLGETLLLVASDRISAYDYILPDEIPFKGEILTALSLYWLGLLKETCRTHFISADENDFPDVGIDKDYLAGRTMLVKKAKVVPIECIVRGYISGSAWREYRFSGKVAGVDLPGGLRESEKFSVPLFTPSTKAADGHDENISESQMVRLVGGELTAKLKELSLKIYEKAEKHAGERGVIVADTKFEFGEVGGDIILIDEVLTPDSSRFWPAEEYRPGNPQPSFDKQFVRDYLDDIGWDRKPPVPNLPQDIIEKTSEKYIEAYERITGEKFNAGGRVDD